MSKSVLIVDTPSCCEMCRFINYEPKCRCGMLSYKYAKIEDRFSKLDNCPLRELPEKIPGNKLEEMEPCIGAWHTANGWNDCLDRILSK